METRKNLTYIVFTTVNTVNDYIYIGTHSSENFKYYLGDGIYSNDPETYERSKTKLQLAVKTHGVKCFKKHIIGEFETQEGALNVINQLVTPKFLVREDVYNTHLYSLDTPFTNEKVYQYSTLGDLIKEWDSILEVTRNLNCTYDNIWQAIDNKLSFQNTFWSFNKYDKLRLDHFKFIGIKKETPIYQYDSGGVFECQYDNIENITIAPIAEIILAIKTGTRVNNKYFLQKYAPTFSRAKKIQLENTPIYQYTTDGVFIREWANEATARAELGIKHSIISAIRLNRIIGDSLWRFEKLPHLSKYKIKKQSEQMKVAKYTLDGKLVKEYSSLYSCRQDNGAGCLHVLKGKKPSSKGYVYKYID